MTLSAEKSVLIILICAAVTFFERLLPFLVFGKRKLPKTVEYLGKVLPPAVITALVVYCMRGISFVSVGGFVPQITAGIITAALHLWKHNTLLSVVGGTAVYMLLIHFVF